MQIKNRKHKLASKFINVAPFGFRVKMEKFSPKDGEGELQKMVSFATFKLLKIKKVLQE